MKKILLFLDKEITRIIISLVFLILGFILGQSGFSLLSFISFILVLLTSGYRVFFDALRGLLRRDLLDEKFLMSIASVGAFAIGEYSEGAAVMLFFLVGETFEHLAVRRSRSSIRALMDFLPDEATLLTDEGERVVDADEVELGDRIIVRPGERIAVDCVVQSGRGEVDTSSMTGESLPLYVKEGDELCAGFIVLKGLFVCEAQKIAEESSAQRILELVENASDNKSKEEKFITKFSRVYTPTVVTLALLLAILPTLFGLTSFEESIYRALIFLVISCPCALVISVPMAFFGGIGGSASRGILFKGGNVFSKLAAAQTVAFDKTGTLTTGEFSVERIECYGIERERLLYLISSCEYISNHPIARTLKKLSETASSPDFAQEILGEGTVAFIGEEKVAVGNALLMKRMGVEEELDPSFNVYASLNSRLVGGIVLTDEIKNGTREAVDSLYSLGIKRSVILSGDKTERVKRAAERANISEALGELSPEEKYEKLGELIDSCKSGTIYVGDGINDAPSLALADVGVSMGGVGQDSAIEASDIVLMTDELSKLPEAVKIARKTLRIAKENILFALGIKGLVLILGALGFANMWLAVFADVGVAVLAILNSMRALTYARRGKK